MGKRIGLIAGSGEFPFLALEEAKKQGYECVVAAIRGEATGNLKMKSDKFAWIDPVEVPRLISFFKESDVREVIMVGKVQQRTIYRKGGFDETFLQFLSQLPDRSPSAVLRALIDFMSREGISVKDPSFLISPYFCPEGVLTKTGPDPDISSDIAYGWKIAKAVADMDIGQTIIVKNRAVVAVEAMEGTDEAIKRGGRIAGEGIVVIKVTRTDQDMRIDVPAVGLGTLKSMIRVGGSALCFEASRMPFFQREAAVELADGNKIVIMAKKA